MCNVLECGVGWTGSGRAHVNTLMHPWMNFSRPENPKSQITSIYQTLLFQACHYASSLQPIFIPRTRVLRISTKYETRLRPSLFWDVTKRLLAFVLPTFRDVGCWSVKFAWGRRKQSRAPVVTLVRWLRWATDDLNSSPGKELFFLSKTCRLTFGPTQPPIQKVRGGGGGLHHVLKRPRCETHRILLSTAKVKTGGALHLLLILLHSVYRDICASKQLDKSKS
jgi:hypothetical protein